MVSTSPVIGVDESGKGDFFGPLVVGALAAPDSDQEILKEIGVRDGKTISNKRLLLIDELLRERYPFAVLVIDPIEYNRRYREIKNLNKLLAWGHAKAIQDVLAKCGATRAVSDKFGKSELIERELKAKGIKINLLQLERGEAVIQVAAGSILARAAFLRRMDDLSEQCGIRLPRGAAPQVDQAGRKLVGMHGVESLQKVAKLHFKNFQRVTNPTLFSR